MKLSDFLYDVGRPVAYYPSLARALGGVKQAVFLCQLIYWSDKGSDPNGWIFKTQEEWRDETGLSFDEQRTARMSLVETGILEEWHQRLIHRMNYRVNRAALDEFWEISRNGEPPFPEIGKRHFGKSGNAISGNRETQFREVGIPNLDIRNRDYKQRLLTENSPKFRSRAIGVMGVKVLVTVTH